MTVFIKIERRSRNLENNIRAYLEPRARAHRWGKRPNEAAKQRNGRNDGGGDDDDACLHRARGVVGLVVRHRCRQQQSSEQRKPVLHRGRERAAAAGVLCLQEKCDPVPHGDQQKM